MSTAKNIGDIKAFVKNECATLGHVSDWFFSVHLEAVEQWAEWLLERVPEADKEIVRLSVWLHDTQHYRGVKGDHEQIGAQEAEKILREFKYDEVTIKKVREIILTHSCEERMPTSIEGRVLAAADGMAHYTNNFYLYIACTGQRTVEQYKTWALEKLDRDMNVKISFDFAKEEMKPMHDALIKALN